MSCRHKVYLLLQSSREIVVSKTILFMRTVIVMMTRVKCRLFIVTEITAGSDRAGPIWYTGCSTFTNTSYTCCREAS